MDVDEKTIPAGGHGLVGGLLGTLRAYWPVIVIWAAVLVFNWPLLAPFGFGQQHIVFGDFGLEFFPFHHFATQQWWQGTVPLWDPYVFGGHPYQADPQSALFNPVGLFVTLLSGPAGLTVQMLEWQLVLDQMLAAAFVFAFVRQLTGNRAAASIAAIAFAFGGFLTSYPMQSMPILESVIWLPLSLFFLERAIASPNRRITHFILAGLACGLIVLSGHPQTALYSAYFLIIYAIYRAWHFQLPWRSVLLGGLLLMCSALGLAAVQLLPTVEFTTFATRGAALASAMSGQGYSLDSLVGLLLPFWKYEYALYAGAPVLMLIIVAWLRPRGETIFWSIIALISLLIALGNHTPLYPALYSYAPGFALFQDQERIMMLFALATSVLAGLGFQQLAQHIQAIDRWKLGVILIVPIVLICLALIAAWSRGISPPPNPDLWRNLGYFAVFMLLTILVVFLSSKIRLVARYSGIVLCVLLFADLFLINSGSNVSAENPLPQPELVAAVQSLRDYPEPYRIIGQSEKLLPTSFGSLLDAQHMQGFSPMVIKNVAELQKEPGLWRAWQLFNVRFIVTKQTTMGDAFEVVRSVGDINIFHTKFTQPRLWAAGDVRVVPDDAENLRVTLDKSLDPDVTVVLEQAPTLAMSSTKGQRLQVSNLVCHATSLTADVSMPSNTMLVFSEAYYPGWQAYLDGVEVPIFRADHALRAIELPAGAHKVEMRYVPLPFYVGLAITICTLLLAVAVIFFDRRRRVDV